MGFYKKIKKIKEDNFDDCEIDSFEEHLIFLIEYVLIISQATIDQGIEKFTNNFNEYYIKEK